MSNSKQLVKNTLSNDSFLQVNKSILRDLGNANAALVLTSLISKHTYFESKNELINDSFFNTKEMLIKELGLSEKVILRAEKILETKGYVTSQLRGLPRKKYYTLQWECIIRILRNVGSAHTECMLRDIPNRIGNNNHTIIPHQENRDIKIEGERPQTSTYVPHNSPFVSLDTEYENEQMKKFEQIKRLAT